MFTTGNSKKQNLPQPSRLRSDIVNIKPASGYSLLEVALTLPILFIIMIGAYDVSTAYHGYTALREGVEAANRCTWTTDGECSAFNSSGGGATNAYYNWTAYDASPSQYFGYKYRYYGTEYHLSRPQVALDNFTVYSLGTRTFDYSSNLRRFAQLRFPAEGIRPRVLQALSPHLNITRIAGGRPNVSATYINGGGNYSNNISYTVSGAPNLQWNGTRSGTVSFTLSAPSGLTTCRVSENFDGNGNHSPGAEGCVAQPGYNVNRGYASLVVYGNDANSQTGSSGRVRMRISGPGLSGQVPLGARAYSYGDDASFCPRVPSLPAPSSSSNISSYVTTDMTTCAESVPGTYQGFSQLRFGETYTLHFDLQNVTGGDLQWSFDGLDIYLPRISSAWNSWRECTGGVLPSEMQAQAGCTVPNGNSAPLLRWTNQNAQPGNYISQDGAFTPPGPATPSEPSNFPLEHRFSSTPHETISTAPCPLIETYVNGAACSDWFEVFSSPQSGTMTQECSPNFGTSITAMNNGTMAGLDEEGARTECGEPEADAQLFSVNPTPVTYTVATTLLDQLEPIVWEAENCTENNPPLPPAVTQYPHRTYSEQFIGYGDAVHLGTSIDPRPLLETAEYSCERAGAPYRATPVTYDHATTTLPFFEHIHFEHAIGCEEDDWTPAVRARAILAGMNPSAFMEAGRNIPGLSSGNPHSGIKAPVSEAIFNEFAGTSCEMEMVPGQPSQPVGSADGSCLEPLHSAPAELCAVGGVVCVQEFGGFCGNGALGGSNPPPQSALEAEAQQHFFHTLKKIYPAAQLGCTGKNCANFGAPAGYDPSDPGLLAQWEGTLQVPLLSANLVEWFTGDTVDIFGEGRVSFSLGTKQARQFERSLVR